MKSVAGYAFEVFIGFLGLCRAFMALTASKEALTEAGYWPL